MENLEKLKKDKPALKLSLTKCLNELAIELLLEAQKERITERLQYVERRRDELLELLENLQALYKEKNEATNIASTEDEADGIVDSVDNEMSGARTDLVERTVITLKENNQSYMLL